MDNSIQVSVKHVSDVEKNIFVKISAEEVKQQYEFVIGSLIQQVEIKGFRKGKAPKDIVQAKFKDTIEKQVDNLLLNKAYYEGLRKNEYEAAATPQINNLNRELDGSFSVEIFVEIKPIFDPVGYDGIELIQLKEPGDGAIENRLSFYQAKVKKGESLPELNDDTAKELGFGTLERLRDKAREDVKKIYENSLRISYEDQILQHLFKVNQFNIPRSMIEVQAKDVFNQIKNQFNYKDEPSEDVMVQVREIAEMQLRRMLILEKIYHKERDNIKSFAESLGTNNIIEKLAERAGMAKQEFIEKNRKDYVNLMFKMMEENVIEFILLKAKIRKEEVISVGTNS